MGEFKSKWDFVHDPFFAALPNIGSTVPLADSEIQFSLN